ncbi:hypothetical protein GPALN_010121 [Globodera pallida]|nr:hypothetical protein GPALN_010121 [Globodera pallida]
MFKNGILFFVFMDIMLLLCVEADEVCNCPSNEQPGQLRCAGCEPTCNNQKPEICTLMHCTCSCDCMPGMFRDSQTNQCVSQEQCAAPPKKE